MKEMAKRSEATPKTMAAASIGDCIHVAGIFNFFKLAESAGWETQFIGSAKSPEEIAIWTRENRPQVLAIGYRLDPSAASRLIQRLVKALDEYGVNPKPRLIFGGTPPVAEVARASGVFEKVFSGEEDISETMAYLRGESGTVLEETTYPSSLIDRIKWKSPYPIIRHHFGLPSLDETISGIETLADSEVLDVISIGPDQNAQENFFHPEEMDPDQQGSGGVPVRSAKDFERLYQASRRGNYPPMRCYSGTRDVIPFARVLLDTINNAWAAIPLSWYNVLDKRGPREIEDSMKEAQQAIKWHADQGIPVEVNESHQWSLRWAPDVIAVATAYLAALTAKTMGVKDYVSQFMFNTPPETSATMDLGKMLAKLELIEQLADCDFRVWREVRAGLASFPVDLDMAKGHLATSTLVSMNMKPHILHVVSYCEANHAATPGEIIESCKIAEGVIANCIPNMPDMTLDPRVQARKLHLIQEAKVLLGAIEKLPQMVPELSSSKDPLTDPKVLAFAIKLGLLDAPHLAGNPAACGKICTAILDGGCEAIDPVSGEVLSESQRVSRILDDLKNTTVGS